eukprot:GILK01004264.1.p1 GENE.GILK01004264.1~~GILK01004264.1.p1  ORF type:complete len:608 (+),score=83.03 GILK01004264.1:88-1911(+)
MLAADDLTDNLLYDGRKKLTASCCSSRMNLKSVPVFVTATPFLVLVLVLISNLGFGVYFGYDSIGSMSTQIKDEYKFTDSQIGWLYSAYALPNTILPLINGYLVDRIGEVPMSLILSGLVIAGSTMISFTSSLEVMLCGRMIYGLGAESLLVCQQTMLSVWFCDRGLNTAFGVNTAWVQMGSAVSFIALAKVGTTFGLTSAFRLVVLVNIFSFTVNVVYAFLDFAFNPVKGKRRFQVQVQADPSSAPYVTPSFVSTGPTPTSAVHASSSRIDSSFCQPELERRGRKSAQKSDAASSLLIMAEPDGDGTPHNCKENPSVDVDIAVDKRSFAQSSLVYSFSSSADRPDIADSILLPVVESVPEPASFVSLRDVVHFPAQYWCLTMMSLLVSSSVYSFCSFGPSFLQEKFGLDEPTAGAYISSVSFCVIAAPLFGSAVDRWGKRPYVFMGCTLLYAVSFLMFAMMPSDSHSLPLIIFIGIIFSVSETSLYAAVPLVLPPSVVGTGYGVLSCVYNTGLCVTPSIVGFIRDRTGSYDAVMIYFSINVLIACCFGAFMNYYDSRSGSGKLNLPSPTLKAKSHMKRSATAALSPSKRPLQPSSNPWQPMVDSSV